MLNTYASSPKLRICRNIPIQTAAVFLFTLILCFSLVGVVALNRSSVEKLTMEQIIMEKSVKIDDVISKLLYKTHILSSFILQSNGDMEDFELTAAAIIDDPAIMNILIAPSGVVSDVYPLEGNETVVGLDFFAKGSGNKEAALAKETGQLVLGGPFNAVQGGQVLVGRLPVYINGTDGNKIFWGLVSITLKYPQALEGVGLSELKIQGFAYEIWRINPDNNEKQIISNSGHSYNPNTNYVEKQLSIANANWYFRILPVKAWYEFPETWLSVLISICISLLVAAVTENNRELRVMRDKLKILSNEDPLTGIFNRRYFMDAAAKQMNRISRAGSESFVIMFDLDNFKMTNDEFGHQAGDNVLTETAARVTRTLRSYDLFARYGGEEFIIFAADIDKAAAIHLAERIRSNIADIPVVIGGLHISVTASFGVAPVAAAANELNQAIALADTALYKAKKEGRNKVVFYNGAERISQASSQISTVVESTSSTSEES